MFNKKVNKLLALGEIKLFLMLGVSKLLKSFHYCLVFSESNETISKLVREFGQLNTFCVDFFYYKLIGQWRDRQGTA